MAELAECLRSTRRHPIGVRVMVTQGPSTSLLEDCSYLRVSIAPATKHDPPKGRAFDRSTCTSMPMGNNLNQTPPGWYPAPGQPGFERLWDGSDWTDSVRQLPTPNTPPPPPTPAVTSKVLPGWSLGLGIAAYVLAAPGLSIPAVICGHLHLSKTTAGPGKSRGLAIGGLVLGYLAFAIYLVG